MTSMETGGHPRPEIMAAYIDRQLEATEQAHVEEHLASCATCRRELLEVQGLVDALPRARRRFRYPAAGLLAAAGLAGLMLLGRGALVPERTAAPAVRGERPAAPATALRVHPLAPVGVVARDPDLRFHWEPAGHDALYDFSLVDAAGAVLWQTRTAESAVTLPAEVAARLVPGPTFYWRADVLLTDLRTGTTGDIAFRFRE